MFCNSFLHFVSDGIGKVLAVSFAKNGYTIHILGRNEQRLSSALKLVKSANPQGEHKTFKVDLSSVENNNKFLEQYKARYQNLDLLVLNANALPNKPILTIDGIDQPFMVSFISRNMFSLALEEMLQNTENSRVTHIGGATMVSHILYDRLNLANYGGLKATGMGFTADNLFVNFANKNSLVNTPHEFLSLVL